MNLKKTLLDNNYSIIASNGYYSTSDGIKPVIYRLNENLNYFEGLEVVDKIVGKASAMLFALSKAKKVHALILSEAGRQTLEKYNIAYQYDELVPYIINRKGDGMCPMEMCVKDVDDLHVAYTKLNETVKKLSEGTNN